MSRPKRFRRRLDRTLPDFCNVCGSRYEIVRRKKRSSLWGTGTYALRNGKRDEATVTVHEEYTRCRKCKDSFFTFDQSMALSRQVIRASWEVLCKRLGYRRKLWPYKERP